MRHQISQHVQRHAGVGAELGVGVPERVREDACLVEAVVVLVDQLELIKPG